MFIDYTVFLNVELFLSPCLSCCCCRLWREHIIVLVRSRAWSITYLYIATTHRWNHIMIISPFNKVGYLDVWSRKSKQVTIRSTSDLISINLRNVRLYSVGTLLTSSKRYLLYFFIIWSNGNSSSLSSPIKLWIVLVRSSLSMLLRSRKHICSDFTYIHGLVTYPS